MEVMGRECLSSSPPTSMTEDFSSCWLVLKSSPLTNVELEKCAQGGFMFYMLQNFNFHLKKSLED